MTKLKQLLKKMKTQQMDLFYILNPANIEYLTGFTGGESALIINNDDVTLITDGRFIEQAKKELIAGINIYRWKTGLLSDSIKLINDSKKNNVWFEANELNYSDGLMFVNNINLNAKPIDSFIEGLREIKDETEIEKIKHAAFIVDKTFIHMLDFIKPGLSEQEIGAELDYTMAKFGSQKPSFETIVASGVRSTYAHGEPTSKLIEIGDMLTLDFGATYQGYVSDMTRTIAIGKPDSRMLDFYNLVLDAENAGINKISDGVKSKELDATIRSGFIKNNVNKYLYHGLGHSIGLDIHESPYITFRDGDGDKRFKTNMVQTIEPGLYLPKVGGVRIEDDVLIQNGKSIVLTKAPKSDLIILPFIK